jgi:hypothetical protein
MLLDREEQLQGGKLFGAEIRELGISGWGF